MKSHSARTAGPKAGSNAGRGFRYQDLVGALLVTRMYLGEVGFDAVVPEGSDDYEIRSADRSVLVDTKSNRVEARQRSESDDAASLQRLWARRLIPGAQISEYWLVTERGRDGAIIRVKHCARSLFSKNASAKSAISFVLIEPDPLQAATALLATLRGITPLAAELVAIAFAHAVGELASINGPLDLEQREAITGGDAERIAARVLSAIDADKLEALLRLGFVSAVDFSTPLDDPGFYVGVDVQPGHFVAGLALERPGDAARIVEALSRSGAVVIRGPSGAGKSGLMWNAVLAARQARRWFRVNTSVAVDPAALTCFFHAYESAPIGFVIDDIGRSGVEAWSALRLHSRAHTRAVMIGSIRSEDAALLPARHTIVEIDASADSQLARAIWVKLRERGQTQWPGWSEPWGQSHGLLLEYGHILTAGARLSSVILDQIRTRLVQERDNELAILRASALVAAHGGSVVIETLRSQLKLNAGDLARALERLIAEHLVRVDIAGATLSGLHALRAASISSALAEVGYSTLEEQAKCAIAVSDVTCLEKVIAGLLTLGAISDEAAAEAAAARLVEKVALSDIAAAVRGLRSGLLTLVARNWLATLATDSVPRKYATTFAMMGFIAPAGMPDVLRKAVEHGNRLLGAVAAQRFPASLASALIVALRDSVDLANVAEVVDAVSALARAPLTPEQRSELAALPLMFDDLLIADIVRILDAAESVDPAISSAWIGRRGRADLLQRLSEETPFALPITREVTDDGIVVYGDIYAAAVGPGESTNDRLVAHVDSIMRLEPKAARAHVRLVDMNGERSLHLDSEKRIPRENAPPKAMAQSNRRIVDVVAAEVASASWSHYLDQGERLLKRGLWALRHLLDSVTVGLIDEKALDALNEIVAACDDLIAPLDPPSGELERVAMPSGRHLTPLQNLIFSSNAELVLRMAKLPEGAAALAAHVGDLVEIADEAKQEPWSLVRSQAPGELADLQQTLRKLELIALEAAASGLSPRAHWRKKDGKPKGAFDLLALHSRNAFLQRIEARRAHLLNFVVHELPGAVLVGPATADGVMWRTRFVATFPLATYASFERWIGEAHVIGERLRARVEASEDIALIPLINGFAAVDYAYQLSRGSQDSIVAPMLIAAGQASLLTAPHRTVVDKLDAPVIRHPIQMERFAVALRDLIAMHQLALGGPGRPEVERKCFERAFSDISVDGSHLLDVFRGINHPAIDALRGLVDILRSGNEGDMTGAMVSSVGIQEALAMLTWHRSQAQH